MQEETIFQKAVLVGIATSTERVPECELQLDELERLLETAGGTAFAKVVQVKSSYDPRTCIGSGKVEEIAELCKNHEISLVVFDFELSPSQIRNLEEDISVSVIDRTMLILDIFALHATTGEGKMQVELAQLKYTAPRLIGKGAQLSRQGGGIGTRGPGESQLETDRRHVKRRIAAIEMQIAEMEKNRSTMRMARDKSGLPKLAIVGYTNAGKSTLLNLLTDAGVLAEDKLFATLDPTTRRLTLPCGDTVLMTDTVGLIRNLPHHLIKAFHSTLEEASLADILVIVIDSSDPEHARQLEVTDTLLNALHAGGKPTIFVYNKSDKSGIHFSAEEENKVAISAKTGAGIDTFLQVVERVVKEGKVRVTLKFDYNESGKLHALYRDATVEEVTYGDDGIYVRVWMERKFYPQYQNYQVGEAE